MDPLRTSANNSSHVGPSSPPAKTSAVPSLLDRIKAVANKALDKFDEIYDKMGLVGQIAFYVVVIAVPVGALAVYVGTIAGLVGFVASIALEGLLKYRNDIYKHKKFVDLNKPLEVELTKINKKFDSAKFDEQLDKCTNKEELQGIIKSIRNTLDEVKEEIEALAIKYSDNKSLAKDVLESYKRHYKYVKIHSEADCEDIWQVQKEFFTNHLATLTTDLKKQLDLVRKLIKE
jgi:hypothetical protein